MIPKILITQGKLQYMHSIDCIYVFTVSAIFTWSLTLAQLQSQFCNQTNLQLILQSGKLSGSCFPLQFTGSVDA